MSLRAPATARAIVILGAPRAVLALRAAVYALIAISIAAFFLVGADGPARPYLTNTYLPGWPHQGVSHP